MTPEPERNVGANDIEWLARVEDAGINATAPREQRWVDGWLVRLSPGKAKRARCIQPVAPGRRGVDEKLAHCLALYAAAGLHPYVRITPFAQPTGLDSHLAARGMASLDASWVMTAPTLDAFADAGEQAASGEIDARLEAVDSATFAEWIGMARGSSPGERLAHAARLTQAAVPHHAVLARDRRGVAIAGGQVAIEEPFAGLYDIFTLASARKRGCAERVCRHLLGYARQRGASVGYLQVEADNEGARRIYARLGFRDAYPYHYRTPATTAVA